MADREAPPSENEDYTLRTRDWLDRVFALPGETVSRLPHQPVHGFGSETSAPCQAPRLARTGRMLAALASERFETVLDVGAGEAYTVDLARDIFGVNGAACDLSREACLRGRELFGVPTFACNAARLPFEDGAFDAVVSSEVLEHLDDPFGALAEMARVARRLLLITTQECGRYELERRLTLRLRNFSRPHVEINWWLPADFRRLLGPGVETRRQYRPDGWPGDAEKNPEVVKRWLAWATDPQTIERRGVGVIALARFDAPGEARLAADGSALAAELARAEREGAPLPEALWDLLVAPRPTGRGVAPEDEARLREALRCPTCLKPLSDDGRDALHCPACAEEYPAYGAAPDFTAPRNAGERPAPERALDAQTVRRLRRLFRRDNVAQAPLRRAWDRALLGAVESVRDLRIGRGARLTARLFAVALREAWRECDPRCEGLLVRACGAEAVYRIEKSRRRHIVDEKVFFEIGALPEDVREVEPQWLERFPEGEPITAPE